MIMSIDYVHWLCSIDYCVKLSLMDETLSKKKKKKKKKKHTLRYDFSPISLGKCTINMTKGVAVQGLGGSRS